MFDYDWWHGQAFQSHVAYAKRRCAENKYPGIESQATGPDTEFGRYLAGLDARIIICLRDGLNYEINRLVDVGASSYLTVECVPGDESQRHLTPILAVPFDEIVRVEVVGIHPSEKHSDGPHITGFRAMPEPSPQDRDD
mgnify:FL=1